MPSTSSTGRTRHPWLIWGVPIAILVMLAAAGVGIASRERADAGFEPVRGHSVHVTRPSKVEEPGVVLFTKDAFSHPDYDAVRSVLQVHFDAINQGNYDRWQTTVVDERINESPEGEWHENYDTTTDEHIKVHRIEAAPKKSLRVLISFTSKQSPEDAPDKTSRCTHWRVVYPLVEKSGQLLIDAIPYGGSAQHTPC